MAFKLSSIWQKEQLDKMDNFINSNPPITTNNPNLEWTFSLSIPKKFIVISLSNKNIPFKVLNLGCGISKITTDTNICPKCKGSGHC